MGITREDRVANAFDFSIWCPGMICHYGLTAGGVFSQAVGKCDPIEVWRRMDQYKFTVILGEPTWLIRLTEIAEREGGGHLKMMVGGAEEIPVAAREWMSKVWNGAYVKMAYAAVENASGLGFQPCDQHDGYHLDTANFCTEIVDQDANGYGRTRFHHVNPPNDAADSLPNPGRRQIFAGVLLRPQRAADQPDSWPAR